MAKRRKKKPLITTIIVLIIVLLGVVGVLAWVVVVKKPFEKTTTVETEEKSDSEITETKTTWPQNYIYWAQWKEHAAVLSYPVQRMKGDGLEAEQVFLNDWALNSLEGAAISPDGDQVAYACVSGVSELCIKDIDGTNLIRPSLKSVPNQFAWSHDSKKIVMSALVSDGETSEHQIAVIEADGQNYKELTKNDELPGEAFYPSFSHDDSQILFQIKKDNGDRDIYIMKADGSDVKSLIASNDWEHEPAFSPDGKRVTYTVKQDDQESIWLAKADGSDAKQLTTEKNNKSSRFSPDGQKIVFTSDRDDEKTWEVYIMNTDGSEQTRLTKNSVDDLAPSWSEYKISGLGVDFTNTAAVLDAYLIGRMKGNTSLVKELVAESLQGASSEVLQSMSGVFSRYEIEVETTISQSEKRIEVALHYKDKLKGSENRVYTLNLYNNEKWLVSNEEVKEKSEDTSTPEDIKMGSVEHQRSELETLQKSVDEGSQPWRLDPHMVALNEGTSLGFSQASDTFTLISKVEQGEYSGAGEATVEARHQDSTYVIQLIQPVKQGDKGIWVINSVAKK